MIIKDTKEASMKNKLYYILFPLYLLMTVFIMYINGVFTGNITSYSNLFINAVFLLIIGILFLISVVSFGRLNECTDALQAAAGTIEKEYKRAERAEETEEDSKRDSASGERRCLWELYRNRAKVFNHPVLDEAFQRYRKCMAAHQAKRGMANACELEDYINEDLLDRVGMTHYNSAISGTLTGLGILGTFLGLSLGLGSFDGNDIYTISDNVGPLLEGMKVAFHTSVYGIFFSLVFNFVYRSIMADAYGKLAEFHDIYRECVTPPVINSDETAQTMLLYQANIAHSLKNITELLKGTAAEQTKGIERMVERFTEQLVLSLGTDVDKLGRLLQQACEAQEICSRDYRNMQETTRQLQEINYTMQSALERTAARQEEFARKLEEQQDKLEKTCDGLEDEIGSQLYTLGQMRDLYEE